MTTSNLNRSAVDARTGTVELTLGVTVPGHGSGATTEPAVTRSARLSGTLAEAVLAVSRATSALAPGQLVLRTDSTAEAMSLADTWDEAVGRCAGLVGDSSAVVLTAHGDAGGELVWRLRSRAGGASVDVDLTAKPGRWYAVSVAGLPTAASAILRRVATAAGASTLLGDLDGHDRLAWRLASVGPDRAPIGTCLWGEVAEQARKRPEAVAVQDEAGTTTYAELVAEVDRIASLLSAAGTVPGDLVALDVPRGRDLVAAMLGTWRARCAFVAVDPRDSAERRAHVLEVARPRLLLGIPDGGPADAGSGLVHVDLHAPQEQQPPATCCRPHDVAYVMFTSGSTGAPKGATVAHGGMLNHAWAKLDDLSVTEDDVLAQTGPISFDIVVWQCVAPLVRGARVQVVSDDDVRDPRRTLAVLERTGVTVWQALPALIRAALDTTRESRPEMASLRWIVPTGDALPTDLCHTWLGTYPHVPLLNTYGSTECSDDQCHHVVDRVRVTDPPVMLLGRPIAGMSALVLDPEGRIAPPGVPGELHIGGVGVGPGYWNRPDLTEQRFVHVDGLADLGRLYRSGDLARRRPDGTLEFLSRVDDTVKVRGRRIETALVEEAVRRHPAVSDCAVVGHRSSADLTESRLVAFVVAPDGLPDNLVDHVAALLDEHHVPDHVAEVPRLPLSANGKVDRAALDLPEYLARGCGSERLAPGLESLVARVWSEVLGVEGVGPEDDFFALGGHSLAVGRILGRLRDEVGVDLPMSSVYDHPTVGALADVLAAAGSAPRHGLRRIEVSTQAEGAALPLSDLQQAYWVGESDFLAGGRMRAHLYVELETRGVDPVRLGRALDRVVERHSALRAVVEDGEQRLLADVPEVVVGTRVTEGLSVDEHERVLEETRSRFRDHGPTTSSWPLFEVTLVEREGCQRVFAAISLLVADAQSEALLVDDLVRAYREDPVGPVPRPGAYAEVARAVAAAQERPDEQDVAHWKRALADFPGGPALPWSRAVDPGGTFTRRTWTLDEDSWSAFRVRSAQHGLTPTAALFAVYCSVIRHWSKSPRFVVNTLASLRLPLAEHADGLLGNLSSTLPSVVDLAQAGPFVEVARRLQRSLVADLEHARVSGVSVVRRLAAEHGWAEPGALPVVFASTLDVVNPSLDDLPVPARVVSSGVQTPHVRLDHQIYDYGGRFHAMFDSVDAAFEPGVVEAMFAAYCRCVEALASGDDAWGEVAIPAEAPDTSAGTPLLLEDEGVLHAPFVRRARTSPHAVAVVDADGTHLTYGELLARAQELAASLVRHSVGRGDLVAHVMRRGWEQVVAILGTHMAGAAYLPVDAALPDDRVDHLVAQATTPVVLAQRDGIGRLSRLGHPTLDVSACTDSRAPEVLVDGGAGPEDVAYVIFTSGSMGLPKGVTIDHRGAVNTVAAINEQVGLDADDVVLGLSSTSFDLSVWDVFGPLATGGRLVLLSAAEHRDPAHWHDQVVRHGVTVWNSVPALLDLYVGYVESGLSSGPADSLRLAMLSGDWIPVPLPDRARAVVPGLEVLSLGGATEASIWSIQYAVDEVDPAWPSIPYGTALPGQGMHVLDEGLGVRPDHAVGEICISGVGLALGYWRDSERTAERFVVHPDGGVRLYRTGDLGVRRPDDVIEFLGREDNQVKIQGHRVELGEIEARLATHPGVSAAVVVARETDQDGKVLAGYVVGDGLRADELRHHVANALPGYMVPHTLTCLDRLPLTSNGKVDRRALPDPEVHGAVAPRPDDPGPSAQPAGELESAILEQMREVLGLGDSLGVEDSFFASGGNSFTAMRLVGRLRGMLGVDLRLSRVFDARSARGLAAVVAAGTGPSDEVLVSLREGGSGAPVFLAHPVGGSVAAYGDLVDALDPGFPVAGLQSTAGAPGSVRELATSYADVVEAARPQGPVVLGGWSMGGLVAHEIGRVLHERGREVEAVLVIDSTPAPERSGEDLVVSFLFDLASGRMAGEDVVEAMRSVLAGGSGGEVAVLVSAGIVPDDADAVVLRERFEMFAGNARMLARHEAAPCPRRCDVPTVVVHASTSHLNASQTRDAWRSACDLVQVVEVPGDHYSVVRGDGARRAAAALEAALGGATDVLPGGVVVRDDHRWMEDWHTERFRQWLGDQGARTQEWLHARPEREGVREEIQDLVDGVDELTNPQSGGAHVFALLRSARDATPRLVLLTGSGGHRTVLDTSVLDDGLAAGLGARSHVSIDWFTPAPTGDLVAVGLSVDGSESATLVMVDLNGRPVPGLEVTRVQPMRINRATVGGATWRPDGRAFGYLRLRETDRGDATAVYQGATACVRTLDEPAVERVVAGSGLNPGLDLAPDDLPLLTLLDADRAVLTVAHGSSRERSVYVASDASATAPASLRWRRLAGPEDRVHAWCVHGEEWFAGRADDEGWSVSRCHLEEGDHLVTVCSVDGSALEDLVVAGERLVVRALIDGVGAVAVLDPSGDRPASPWWLPLPERCGVGGVVPLPDGTMDVLVTHWVQPTRLVRIDPVTGESRERWSGGALRVGAVEASVEHVEGSDGVLVPVTVLRPAGSQGPVPVWLTAYGFFGITLRPVFTPLFVAWLRRGGAVAIAHVRGGGDRGDAWYRAGHREHTDRTVQDLLDVSRHFVRTGMTTTDLTVVEGTSAGGLTVGGAMVRDPGAFGAVVMRVSLTNTLRLEMHENGPSNVPEYGSIATAEGVRALLASDVYHRVDRDVVYPPVLLTVGLRDPRVLPWQPAKLAARLQRRAPESARLRVEEHGGHGVGASTSQTVAEAVDRLCFALDSLGRRDR